MKNYYLILLAAIFCFSETTTFASTIYCEDDSGEALSEVYDAYDTATQFEIVGLDPSKYPLLVNGFGSGAWESLHIWEIAELEQKNSPEIYAALANWVESNCN